jgi:hypothetical protein
VEKVLEHVNICATAGRFWPKFTGLIRYSASTFCINVFHDLFFSCVQIFGPRLVAASPPRSDVDNASGSRTPGTIHPHDEFHDVHRFYSFPFFCTRSEKHDQPFALHQWLHSVTHHLRSDNDQLFPLARLIFV